MKNSVVFCLATVSKGSVPKKKEKNWSRDPKWA